MSTTHPPGRTVDRRSAVGLAVLSALLLTGLNATKPLVVDDPAYVQYARNIAQQPLDPYGFDVFWYHVPEPAHEVLAPPVLPYWLGGAVALFGERPALWKWWLLPFSLAFAFSLLALARRFAPGLEGPLVAMTLLSPAVLPNYNLMLDIPVQALACSALAVFFAALDRRNAGLAVAAGIVAGLAVETKYNGATATLAIVAFAAIAREWRLGLLAAASSAAVFVGWEAFMAAQYGDSHFVRHALTIGSDYVEQHPLLPFFVGFLSLLGATATPAALVALAALRVGRWGLVAALVAIVAAFAAVPFFAPLAVSYVLQFPELSSMRGETALFALLGAGVAACFAWLLVVERDRIRGPHAFLAAWLAIELVAFFALSPFLAARRVIALNVVLILVAGAAAARSAPRQARRLACVGVALGLLFFAADLSDARARERAAYEVVERVRALGSTADDATIWFTGQWGFRFHGERAGMKPLVPGTSELERGDFVVLPLGVWSQRMKPEPELLRQVADFPVASAYPWSTVPHAHGSAAPIRPQPAAQLRIYVFQAEKGFVPQPIAQDRPGQPAMIRSNEAAELNNRGTAASRDGRLDEAIVLFSEALEIVPDYARAHNNLANAYMRKGEVELAIPHYEAALASEPEYALAHVNFANALVLQREEAAAIPHFREFLRLRPDTPPVMLLLARLLATHPDPDIRAPGEAIALATAALEQSGPDRKTLEILGCAYAAAERFDAAIEIANMTTELSGLDTADLLEIEARVDLFEREEICALERAPAR